MVRAKNKLRSFGPLRGVRSRRGGPARLRWPALFSRQEKRGKAWQCNHCGVIGSHRRGCHYVTETHHRPPKTPRHGVLGKRARARRKDHMPDT